MSFEGRDVRRNEESDNETYCSVEEVASLLVSKATIYKSSGLVFEYYCPLGPEMSTRFTSQLLHNILV